MHPQVGVNTFPAYNTNLNLFGTGEKEHFHSRYNTFISCLKVMKRTVVEVIPFKGGLIKSWLARQTDHSRDNLCSHPPYSILTSTTIIQHMSVRQYEFSVLHYTNIELTNASDSVICLTHSDSRLFIAKRQPSCL